MRKMRILFITTFYPCKELPQYGIFVHEEAKALQNRGHAVTILNPRTDIHENYNWEYDGLEIYCLRIGHCRTNYSNILNSYFLYRGLASLNNAFYLSFDVIHVHNCLPEGNAVRMLNKKLNQPMVIQIHGLDVFHTQKIRTKIIKKIFYKCCRRVYQESDSCIGVSNKVSNYIRQCLSDSDYDKVNTVYNGFNPLIFNDELDDNREEGLVRILFAGNIIELKGIRNLIHAYCQLYCKFTEPTELWIFGRGKLEKEMRELVKQYDMEEHVTFKGYVTSELLAQGMKKSDIFVMPSTDEALGCVYLEAMACGLPCIACQGQGIEEIIDVQTGMLISPGALDELKDALENLVNNREIRIKYQNNIRLMINDYVWSSAAEQIEQIYNTAIEGR